MQEEWTVRKAVELAVKTEEVGHIFYSRLAQRFTEDSEIGDVFLTLAQDELAHREQFKELLGRLPGAPAASEMDERMALLRIMSRSEFFTGEAGLARTLDAIKTRDDALDRAIRLEKDTLGYFQAMRDLLGEEPILEAIIRIEKSHLIKLMEYIITGAKLRGLGDTFPSA